MKPDELQSLMQRMLDGDLPAGEAAELDRFLLANPEARVRWKDMARIHSALETRYAAKVAISRFTPVPIELILQRQRQKVVRFSLAGAAAAVLLLVAGLWLVMAPETPVRLASFRIAPGSDFALSHTTGSEVPAGNALAEGSTLLVSHGVAELLLPHDVRAIVEGPASLTLQDDRTLRLNRGRALFQINSEDGKGFTVMTPHQRIVDLGTSFGVDIGAGQPDVSLHVLSGKVRVDSLDGAEGEIIHAPRRATLHGAEVGATLPQARFLSELPAILETIFEDNFENGLLPERRYSVRMDPSVVTDLAGRPFGGIPAAGWTFETASAIPDSIPLRNPGFEEGKIRLSHGAGIPGWHPAIANSTGWGTESELEKIAPAEGGFFGRISNGGRFEQPAPSVITAGETYVLTLDCALFSSGAIIALWGSDGGSGVPLVEKHISLDRNAWVKDVQLVFTASETHATGQTLGISLGRESGRFVGFDRIRLGTVAAATQPESSPSRITDDDGLLEILSIAPAPGSTDAIAHFPLKLVFNKPIRSGVGRIIVRNESDGTESVLIAGSPQLAVKGNELTFVPRSGLQDGESSPGPLSGWDCEAWTASFNPSGSGWYRNESLRSKHPLKATAAAMRSTVMATIHANPASRGIHRNIARISPDTRYTVTAAIGVRNPDPMESAVFGGYRLCLRSGDTVLAESRGTAPPGPPGSFTSVGFSWDSTELPHGIATGDTISLEIAAEPAVNGYLDLDSIRVTSTATSH